MSSLHPATVNVSINTFAQHGGGTDTHFDGWGIIFYEGNDVRRIRDTAPAVNNEWIKFLEQHSIRSNIVLSHIRKASAGAVALNNTQPFCRELMGKVHSFAHNGNLEGLSQDKSIHNFYQPIGETDSEVAFCILLNELATLWLQSEDSPSLADRLSVIHNSFNYFSTLGPANFIYSDSEYLFAYSDKRTQKNNKITPPGLFKLVRQCREPIVGFNYSGLSISNHFQQAVLVTSVPLSHEEWMPVEKDELIVLKLGKEVK